MGCNCCCSTDKEKDKKPEEKPVDPKVEEAKELKEATVEAVEAGSRLGVIKKVHIFADARKESAAKS